jgi:2-phospho-L-lactate/phosphoenolpyruvate guanylyltransferase
MDAGILPVKNLTDAKSRLAPVLSDEQRLRLATALLEDALKMCASVDFLEWVVVTDDPTVDARARAAGLGVIRDEGRGLNDAIQTALVPLREKADSITIVPVDVPLAFRGDIQDLLDTGATSDVVVVPSARDGGTNALFLSPPDAIVPRFGHASLRAHIAAAEDKGLRCSILSLPRLELDVDTIDDVDVLLTRPDPGKTKTVALLRELRA